MSGQLPKGILQEKVTVRLFDVLIMYMLWLSFILFLSLVSFLLLLLLFFLVWLCMIMIFENKREYD